MPSVTFNATESIQSWKVPKNVARVTVTMVGAVGGGSGIGGIGGRVTGMMTVTDRQTLKIFVGSRGDARSGTNGGSIAFGGGGSGGDGAACKGSSGFGGAGGGGASYIRINTNDGTIKCVAGGGGGGSGDNGQGGDGGGPVAQDGRRGTSGDGTTTVATGGTQSQAGKGGTSSSGSEYRGGTPNNVRVTRGGFGGRNAGGRCGAGGGGGGGGWHPGGGGAASDYQVTPGGGGGGGSNYTGGLTQATSQQGAGPVGNGSVTISWDSPPPADQRPNPPSDLKINGQPETDGLVTKAVNKVTITAQVTDPEQQNCRLLVWLSPSSQFPTHRAFVGENFVHSGNRATVTATGLAPNTRYYGRAWALDSDGMRSLSFNSFNFWMNRNPSAPKLTAPADNIQFPATNPVTFKWDHQDPDDDPQAGFELHYRVASSATDGPGPWHSVLRENVEEEQWVSEPNQFSSSTFYDWTVSTRDPKNRWGTWADPRSFFATGLTAPPKLLRPVDDVAVDVEVPVTFRWQFRTPLSGRVQIKADIRWRSVGGPDSSWVTTLGEEAPGVPGALGEWTVEPGALHPKVHYEWQVRTYDDDDHPASDWSESGTFWSIPTPGGGGPEPPELDPYVPLGSLGCGTYRTFVYARGGDVLLGELSPAIGLTFDRIRDDISHAHVKIMGFNPDCGELMKSIRCWMHELVIFRDGMRVWEGPITRITYTADGCEFEAQDVMVYVYRRIMRQGFNDSYHFEHGEQMGLPTVVDRATRILMDVLAPDDPNILPYLTAVRYDDDARESRIVPDYNQTGWEQIDDLAATAGLDYTTVGRRIILWDTHRSIGRLPMMTDGDFSEPPVVTEYGMQLCNYSAVTNGSGIWAAVRPVDEPEENIYYGPIELLASAYGEADGTADGERDHGADERMKEAMLEQAKRNIANRWPTPIVVRVPDNSTLNPSVNITFDQLVPGVWIPLTSRGTLREVSQWQKLDSVSVTVDPDKGEQVAVVMSPAPHYGEDSDIPPPGDGEGGLDAERTQAEFTGSGGLSPRRGMVAGEGP